MLCDKKSINKAFIRASGDIIPVARMLNNSIKLHIQYLPVLTKLGIKKRVICTKIYDVDLTVDFLMLSEQSRNVTTSGKVEMSPAEIKNDSFLLLNN